MGDATSKLPAMSSSAIVTSDCPSSIDAPVAAVRLIVKNSSDGSILESSATDTVIV